MTGPGVFPIGLLVGAAVLGGIAAHANTRGELPDELDVARGGPSVAVSLTPTRPASRESSPAPKRADLEQRGNPLWGIPFAALAATRERPVFSSSRRPPAPMMAPPPPPVPIIQPPAPVAEAPSLNLVGTVVNDEQGIAVFFDSASRAVVRLKVGQAHSGWVLRRIQGRETSLEKDRRMVTLKLPLPGESAISVPVEPAGHGPVPGVLPGLARVDPTVRGPAPPPTAIQLAPDFLPGAVPSLTGRLPGL